ncbi:rhamnopyranosyl-N-acetylglucosaminyl-diphospho-decaprenol beta-1,3/1,4-galactofuranosyltransferase [Azospirillum brasilense]|uniref:Rhamnopyranosyl-N-acetylglucosaminyl-diphospho-decaprenol beta-1,3/1,4-galactofuranosyltransferase n=1 Tax=Azospirillum brasilense TaxID=192 RepID=A0A560B6H0_AZOBR|nr:glycosyltransferase [Azospirillum brasilense]TWA68224.1 rhamnopyranosyl-N-acetylglucosaminyl-diphospho-decaprenol beta-1,3/1,4-galactofuranosyltransferase [Azospirillum brasilense]
MSEAQTPRTLDTGAQERPRETPWETPVVAVVVTHNRLALLKTCLAAIHGQEPRPDRIVVVDNGSSDGTAEWLAEQRAVMPELLVVRQANIGSAGAYHTAFATALELGARWIWSTDDDGIPAPGALAELLRQGERHDLDLVGPTVVAAEDRGDLAFTMQGFTKADAFAAAAQDGIVPGTIALFNGTLLRRRVFERIGNIKREMFIWGDEWEFTLRARRAGLRDGTAVHALHVHPRNRRTQRPLAGGFLGTIEEMPENRAPYFFRNMGYIHATYERKSIARMMVKYTLYYLLHRRADVKGLRGFWTHYRAGLQNRYPQDLQASPTAAAPVAASGAPPQSFPKSV